MIAIKISLLTLLFLLLIISTNYFISPQSQAQAQGQGSQRTSVAQGAAELAADPVASLEGSNESEKVAGKNGKKKRKKRSKFVYAIGDKYPGVHIGHRECITPGPKIPAKMGWLWNIHTPCLSLKVFVG